MQPLRAPRRGPGAFPAAPHALEPSIVRLLFAVLEDALEVVVGGRDALARPAVYAEALDWVRSRDRGSVFSFENVCAALDMDADRLRRGLLHDACGLSETDCPTPARLPASSGSIEGAKNPWRDVGDGWHRACCLRPPKS